MAGDLDLSRRAQDVDEHKLALAMAHAGMNCGEGAAAGDDADFLALSEHASRGLWRRRRKADDTFVVGARLEGLDLAIGTAGGSLAEANEREHAEGALDRAPLLDDQDEAISAEERRHRAPRFDQRQENLEAPRLEVLGGEGFPLRVNPSAGPIISIWHAGRETSAKADLSQAQAAAW
jgi:hypothetical protein